MGGKGSGRKANPNSAWQQELRERAERARIRALPLEQQFMLHVNVDPETGCWVWDRPTESGRGTWKSVLAYVWAYRHWIGPIPEDKWSLDHLCENKGCVNPWHLEAVTSHENTRRKFYR